MSDQTGYGIQGEHHEPKLVPAALTAYRHFFLYKKAENSGLPALVPMAPHTEAAYGTYHVPWSEWGSGKPATFHAECHWSEDEPRHEGSPAPQLDCSCGFYAHYFDGTDFYPYTKWYPRQESGWTAGKIMVRTVVELSGRIVMGHLGVRAEKLTIKALAIDWDKARESDRVSRYETSSFGEIYPVWEYPVFDMAPPTSSPVSKPSPRTWPASTDTGSTGASTRCTATIRSRISPPSVSAR